MAIRSTFLILPLVLVSACTIWVAHPLSAARSGQADLSGTVRVFRLDHSILTLSGVTLSADSIVGMTQNRPPERVAVPLTDVQTLQTRDVSTLRTAALSAIIGVYALAAVAFYGGGSK
jgi:hypothetical protein